MSWKFMNKGLLVRRDESEVIGVFHCDRRASKQRKAEIRSIIASAEDTRNALRDSILELEHLIDLIVRMAPDEAERIQRSIEEWRELTAWV